MSTPLLTVVIPVYNRADLVQETLQSLERQTLRRFDVVLVDNNSNDGTFEVLTKWANINRSDDRNVTVLREPTRGACAARNTGMAAARTPWVMFFDSDDIMLPNHLADFDAVAQQHPKTDLITRAVYRREPDGKLRILANCKGGAGALRAQIFHSTLATPRFAAKTELVRKAGGWDNRVWGWNDYELGVRLLLRNPSVIDIGGKPSMIIIPQMQSITGTSFSSSPRKWEDALDACQRSLEQCGRGEMVKYINCRRVILAAIYAREGAYAEARRLRKSVPGWRYRAVYWHQRMLRRGAEFTARLLLG